MLLVLQECWRPSFFKVSRGVAEMIQIDDDSAAAAASSSQSRRQLQMQSTTARDYILHESWWVSQHTHPNNKVRVPRLRRWGNHWTWTGRGPIWYHKWDVQVQRLRIYIYIYCRGRGRGSLHLPNLLTTHRWIDGLETDLCRQGGWGTPDNDNVWTISLLTTYLVFSTTNS